MKLSDYVAEFISKYTKHIFVGNGGCVVHILDSMDKHKELKIIPCENEQGAAIAAEAYTRVSGKLGTAIATSGPGMINLLQGIACAYYDSIPSLYISGASPTLQLKGERKVRQLGFQEMNVVGITASLTKYAVLITDPGKIRYELEKLVYLAQEGRPGPVMLDLPDDLQRAEINPNELESFTPPAGQLPVDLAAMRETLRLIKDAKKPVAVVGGGVKLARAQELCRRFLEKSGLPFATTWSTIDMFLDDEPGLVGNFGISANRAGNFVVQNADLILSLGSRLDTHQTGSRAALFAPKAKKIMVDIDYHELFKNNGMPVEVSIQCDLKAFLTEMNKAKIETTNLAKWREKIKGWRRHYPICPPENYKQAKKVNPYVFMNELSKKSKPGDIVITDAGATLTWTMQGYKIRNRQLLFSAFNHSPMGYALPASIGAQFAAPAKRVICIIGDGGMQMNVRNWKRLNITGCLSRFLLLIMGNTALLNKRKIPG